MVSPILHPYFLNYRKDYKFIIKRKNFKANAVLFHVSKTENKGNPLTPLSIANTV